MWLSHYTLCAAACCLFAVGGTAYISESGLLPLGSDRLRICNITGGVFSGCVSTDGFNVVAGSYASSNTVW